MREEDFLLQIAEAPEDLERRMVFADWLLEKGDPLGELISLQIRLKTTHQESHAMRARVRDLLAVTKESCLKRWGIYSPLVSYSIEQGLPARASFFMDQAPLTQIIPLLGRLFPIHTIEIMGNMQTTGWQTWTSLAQHLRVRELRLLHTMVSDQQLLAFCEQLPLNRLTSFQCLTVHAHQNSRVFDVFLLPAFRCLRALLLHATPLAEMRVWIQMYGLEHISLHKNRMDESAFWKLGSMFKPHQMKSCFVHDNPIGDGGAQAILRDEAWSATTQLQLTDCNITGEFLSRLASWHRSERFRYLNLKGMFDEQSVLQFCRSPYFSKLEALVFPLEKLSFRAASEIQARFGKELVQGRNWKNSVFDEASD